ncbi:metal ABC transporter permease [Halomonas urumqiensis]|uniref:Zinc ABC transporter permease n=1 Tax=Halomonas urumqiensis TaxID=1684789 RepID=A0A2N7UQS4_9GAMM|nr:metal ABC transporter permease [Halomonas urumqiensis]PMR82788.1 zinc ABC transporter permease [Halomonas urumqiensis]PTB01893.1 metal ABC transporter permease [Halomonas urumqiensis]GHE21998.1 manganese transport system membrane protein MntD [Halomonas urumqiensis]
MSDFMMFSLVPLAVAVIIGMTCALLGNFLVLRRQSLIGDAISHVALPGIVVSFLLTGALSSLAMMLGAGVSALVTVVLIELVRRFGRVESSAAMGVVFTSLFALGVLLLEWHGATGVHLDVEHALYGNLESLIWFEGTGLAALVDPQALAGLPPQLARAASVGLAVVVFLVMCRRQLILGSFDPDFAASVRARPALVDLLLVTMVAVAAIAAFEAVGSIIVIAMFICPAAAARLMTNRLATQIAWSLTFAAVSSVLGYVLAGYGPGWLGFNASVSAAGMIATLSGVILLLACLFGPERHRSGAAREA